MTTPLSVAAAIVDGAGIAGAAGIADAAGITDSGPRAPGPPDASGVEPRAVVGILRANKVPLLDLPGGACPAPISDSAPWREAVRIETAAREEQRAMFALVSARLRDAGIEPVLFKSAGGFPYRSSNLDTLVLPGRMEDAARLLSEAGHLRMPHYHEEHKLLFHRFRAGRSILSVHLHEAVSWGRVTILPGDAVVARSIPAPGGGHRIASPVDRVVTLFAHALYETDQIRLSDLRALRLAAADQAFSWHEAQRRVSERGWDEGFYAMLVITGALEERLFGSSCIAGELRERAAARLEEVAWAGRYARSLRAVIARTQPHMPFPLSKVNSKVHYVERLLRQQDRAPDERLADVVAMGWSLIAGRLKLRCRPAVVVSFSGLDGSGKSTVVRSVRAAMATCEIPVKVVWSRGGFTRFMSALKRQGRKVLPIPEPGAGEEKRAWLDRPFAGSAFAWVVLFEQLAHHVLRISVPRALGWSIVCDRYACDTAADLLVKAGSRPGVVRATELLMGLWRRPDLAVLLDLSVPAAVRRKAPDVPVTQLERTQRALDALARSHGLARIDADRDDEAVIDEAVERSLRAAFDRFTGSAAGAGGGSS